MTAEFRSTSAQVEIAAPLARVWAIMLDVQRYGEWNPFVYRIDGVTGPVELGSTFTLRVRWTDGGTVSSDEVVTRLEPPTTTDDGTTVATWTYRYASLAARLGLLHAERVQALAQVPGGPTVYTTEERFFGPLRHLVPVARVQAGFDAQAAALRTAAESASAASSDPMPSAPSSSGAA